MIIWRTKPEGHFKAIVTAKKNKHPFCDKKKHASKVGALSDTRQRRETSHANVFNSRHDGTRFTLIIQHERPNQPRELLPRSGEPSPPAYQHQGATLSAPSNLKLQHPGIDNRRF